MTQRRRSSAHSRIRKNNNKKGKFAKAGPVTIYRADGTVEIQQPYYNTKDMMKAVKKTSK